jgi:hypothetical protein
MIRSFSVFILVFLNSLVAFGQSNTDFQSRTAFSIDYKLNKKWKMATEYRYSLENDWQKFRSSSIQLETEYAITKRLVILGGYRFTTSFEEDNHRFFAALKYDYKINKLFTVTAASKFQFSTNSFDPDFMNEFKEPVKMTRQKIGIDFNIPKSKLSFTAGTEIFLKTESQPYFKFNRMRYETGLNYDFKKYGKLGFSVFYDDKISPLKDDRIVLVSKYAISINDLTKKKKKEKNKGN